MSIVELGLVRQINMQPDFTEIKMIMTTPFCPYGPALLEQTRRAAEAHLQHAGQDHAGHGDVGTVHDGRRPAAGMGLVLKPPSPSG